VLSNVGRHDEALATIQRGLVLDPLSLITRTMHGQFLYHAGRDSEEVEQFKVTLEMEPRFWVGQICLAKTYEKQRMYAEALAACEMAREFSGGNSEALSLAGYVHAVSGDRVAAEARIIEMTERQQERYVPPYNIALVFAGLKETEVALNWLRQAVEDRDVHMTFLLDHKWHGLRSDKRFQDVSSTAGFSHGLSVSSPG
jgi:tetratricopeptide (TPR) repeat protein